jgi:hypothetical protein
LCAAKNRLRQADRFHFARRRCLSASQRIGIKKENQSQNMRIIAELPHPDFKISILNMNDKYIVKIEQGNLEQTYKIAGIDLLDGVNSVFEFLDEEFLKTVATRFTEMRQDFVATYKRYNY